MVKVESNLDDLRVPLTGPETESNIRNDPEEIIEGSGNSVDESLDQNIAICRIRIKGLACRTCVESVERAIMMVGGVERPVVDFEEAIINFDPKLINEDKILKAVEDTGYETELIRSVKEAHEVLLKLEGVSSEDMSHIITSLELAVGVHRVDMDLFGQKVTIRYDPNQTGPRSLIQCIEEAGRGLKSYRASIYVPPGRSDIEQRLEIHYYRNLFLLSCLFSIPVSLFSMVLPLLPPYGNWLDYKVHNMLTIGMLLRWILCTPVQFIVGKRFYVESYDALQQKSANMDVLVALGTNTAYFYSLYVVIKAFDTNSFEGKDFFENSSLLISIILLGKYLEVMAKWKISDALAKLAHLAPDTACLLMLDDSGNVLSEMEIDPQLIHKNDIIKILPGAKVPIDGTVINGQSNVNESMITGDTKPVAKSPGDKVIGGTVNENECLLVKATHVGTETALFRIIQFVESAKLARLPAQEFAEKISKFFVPVVLVVALMTWLGWLIAGVAGLYPKHWIPKATDEFGLALQFGISVLVIACPCTVDLASPTAVMVALRKAASLGVFIKGGNTLEKIHKVSAVVIDKTGTLTAGNPEVVSAVVFSNFSMAEVCDVTLALETYCEQPLAKSLVEHVMDLRRRFGFRAGRIERIKDFLVIPKSGVAGKLDGNVVIVGSKNLMDSCNVLFSPAVHRYILDMEEQARSCILVAINGVIAGGFAATDPLKPGARTVISYIQAMGISVIMATGDDRVEASAFAKDADIHGIFIQSNPVDKPDKIKALQRAGMVVAAVGDKKYDAPALAAADVAIVTGGRADVRTGPDGRIDVRTGSDIFLMRNRLEDLLIALHLTRTTIWRIWINYIWALAYSIIGVLIAGGVLYPFYGIRLPPWLAGACMVASSLVVLSFSLLLHCYCKPLKIGSILI